MALQVRALLLSSPLAPSAVTVLSPSRLMPSCVPQLTPASVQLGGHFILDQGTMHILGQLILCCGSLLCTEQYLAGFLTSTH